MMRVRFVARHLDRNRWWSVEGCVEDVGYGWRRWRCGSNQCT